MTEERLTPFMLFYCEVRDKVEKESPKLQPHEVSSEIARRWKALPADQSRAYSVLSATYAEQKKFQKDSPKVPPSPKPVKKRKERYKDPRAPKKKDANAKRERVVGESGEIDATYKGMKEEDIERMVDMGVPRDLLFQN